MKAAFLETLGPCIILLIHTKTGCQEVLNVEDRNFLKVKPHSTLSESDKLHMALYIQNFHSDKGYQQMSFLSNNIPHLYKVKDVARELQI